MDNIKYNLYTGLLIKKDKYLKEAHVYSNEFIKTFGFKIINNYTLQIECARLKKQVEYCQKMTIYHAGINRSELINYLGVITNVYEAVLRRMKKEYNDAKNYKHVNFVEEEQIDKVYQSIARKINPNLNPNSITDKKLKSFYVRLNKAYKANDLNELNRLSILINRYIEIKEYPEIYEIKDLDNRIKIVQDEIEKIITTDPYCFKDILNNAELFNKKSDELDAARMSLEAYIKELKAECHKYSINNKLN